MLTGNGDLRSTFLTGAINRKKPNFLRDGEKPIHILCYHDPFKFKKP